MPFKHLEACGEVMKIVVSHIRGEDELVSRFTLMARREEICLNAGASYELGYPVVKANCSITEHDECGNEIVPQYCAKEEGVMVENLLSLLIFLECWVSEVWHDWEDATQRWQCIQEVYARFEQDGLNWFVPGWETIAKRF